MDTDLVLLLLRIVSAMLLLLILATIYVVMWREYRSLTGPMGDAQHNYGQLMVVEESNGSHITIGESYPLLSRTTLGRAPINSIVLDDTFVSNEHAQIILREGQWWRLFTAALLHGSLLHLLDRTATAMGARLLRQWIGSPLLDVEAIEARPYQRHLVIDDRCTRCGMCLTACPEHAIRVA